MDQSGDGEEKVGDSSCGMLSGERGADVTADVMLQRTGGHHQRLFEACALVDRSGDARSDIELVPSNHHETVRTTRCRTHPIYILRLT